MSIILGGSAENLVQSKILWIFSIQANKPNRYRGSRQEPEINTGNRYSNTKWQEYEKKNEEERIWEIEKNQSLKGKPEKMP